MISVEEDLAKLQKVVGRRIAVILSGVGREETTPVHAADEMDDYIKDGYQRVAELRSIRDRLEKVLCGSLK